VVRLSDDAQAVVLDITNAPAPGRPAGAPAPVSGGHGIRGMRERAELLGGSVEATPLLEGGFRVHARLPSAGRRPE
jgi:signal transduction histidine kinase